MAHSYGLYPWHWNATESCHEPPQGAFAVLDLRPLSEQSVAGQSAGWGFFAWPDNIPGDGPNVAPPTDTISLGYGDCRELQPTTGQRDELRIRLGLSANPGGATLIDTISDCLGSLADPSGQNGPKPLLPTREGSLEIHLSNHSRVWQSAFDGGELFATTAKGRANRIRDVLRSDLETANRSGGPELVSKVLGHWCDRWGVSYAQTTRWRNLIRGPLLAELLEKTGGNFKPRKPQTSYTDDFNDGNLTGWTSVFGTWDNGGTNIRYISTSTFGSIRYESDVSSADHWADLLSVTAPGGAEDRIGPACRFGASARTYYGFRFAASTARLVKLVVGAATNLGSTWTSSGHFTFRAQASGSTISAYEDGVSKQSLTDTSITGNTRGGCACSSGNGASFPSTADSYLIDDGVSAGGQPMALRTAGLRLGWARVGRGF